MGSTENISEDIFVLMMLTLDHAVSAETLENYFLVMNACVYTWVSGDFFFLLDFMFINGIEFYL